MEIVKPDLKDLDEILVLWKKQYEYHYNLDPEYYVSDLDGLNTEFRSYLKKAIEEDVPNILVAKEDSKILGFATFEINKAFYFDTKIKEYGEIVELFVREQDRRKGVGKLLVASAERFFKNKGIVYIKIGCSSFNKNGLDFYTSQNYINRQTLFFKKI